MKRIFDLFLSLKLTVTLLALSMVLVFAGTLAQVDLFPKHITGRRCHPFSWRVFNRLASLN